MRPLLASLFLALVAGPAAYAVIPYVLQIHEALSYAIVFGFIFAHSLPFLWAWYQLVRLSPTEKLIARPCPPIRSLPELYREMFSVWPGLKRSTTRALIADVLTYTASLTLRHVGSLFAMLVFLVVCLMPLFLRTHGIGEVTMQLLALLILLLIAGLMQSLQFGELRASFPALPMQIKSSAITARRSSFFVRFKTTKFIYLK
jgi:hypothetical protein